SDRSEVYLLLLLRPTRRTGQRATAGSTAPRTVEPEFQRRCVDHIARCIELAGDARDSRELRSPLAPAAARAAAGGRLARRPSLTPRGAVRPWADPRNG